jgi:hypothetical protein
VAGAGAIRAGKAFVELSLKDNALTRGLATFEKRTRATFNAVGTAAKGLGLRAIALGTALSGAFGIAVSQVTDVESLASSLGAVGEKLSPAQYVDALRFAEAIKAVGISIKLVAFQVGSALIPDLTDLSTRIRQVMKAAADWAKNNQRVIATVAKIVPILLLAGGALYAAGFAASLVAGTMAAVGTAFGVVLTVLGAIASPIGLAVIGITALAGAFLYFSGIGAAAIEAVKAKLGELSEWATTAFGAITRAIASGQWGLAARIALAEVHLAFIRGVAALESIWLNFTTTLSMQWTNLVFGLTAGWIKASAQLETTIGTTVDFWRNAWGFAFDWLQKKVVGLWVWLAKLAVGTDVGKQIDAQRAAFEKSVDQQRAKDVSERTKRRSAAIGETEIKKNLSLDVLEKARQAKLKALATANGVEQDRLIAEIAQLTAQRDAALAEAAKLPEAKLPGVAAVGGDAALNATFRKSVSQGSFNINSLARLEGNSVEDRIARANEEQVELQKRIEKNTGKQKKRGFDVAPN